MIFSESNVHARVSEATFKRFLRYPPARKFEGPLADNAAWARAWFAAQGSAWMCARAVSVECEGDAVFLANVLFQSTTLAERCRHASAAVIVAASAGPAADAGAAGCWERGEPDRYFFLESYAAAVVCTLLDEATRRIAAWARPATLGPCCGPGYPGWAITDAPALLNLMTAGGPLPGPLKALESGMLSPKKSQLALFAVQPAPVPDDAIH